MKTISYPVIFEQESDGYFVTVPDFDRYTQGKDMADAIVITKDLISLFISIAKENDEEVPAPNSVKFEVPEGAILSYLDINEECSS